MVPLPSIKVPRVSMYSGYRHVFSSFAYGTVTPSGLLSQNSSARLEESIMRSEPRSARTTVWALPVSLAATPGIDVSFSSSGYLDVSVHRVPSVTLCIHVTVMAHYRHRVSPFGYPWIYRLFAAPHGFSQLTTSFFGSWCQGIRPMLLLA